MVSRRTIEVAFAAFTALFGAVIAYGATEFGVGWSPSGPEPGTFPFYIGCLVTLASAANLVAGLTTRGFAETTFISRDQLWRIVTFILPMVGFVVLALLLGLYVATAIYLFAVMRWQGRYPYWHATLVAVGLPVFLFLVLEKGFQVPLLKGPLEAALGL